MNVEKSIKEDAFDKKVISVITSLKNGEGLTKKELAEKFGFVEKCAERWMKKYPEIKNYRVYIKTGRSHVAVFVNLKYKQDLILRGKAKESF